MPSTIASAAAAIALVVPPTTGTISHQAEFGSPGCEAESRIEQHFGPIECAAFTVRGGRECIVDPVPELRWIDARLSGYDARSRLPLDPMSVLAGVLTLPESSITFFGERLGLTTWLFDTEYLMGEEPATLPWNDWLASLAALNEAEASEASSAPFAALLNPMQKIIAAERNSRERPTIRLRTPDGGDVTLLLSRRRSEWRSISKLGDTLMPLEGDAGRTSADRRRLVGDFESTDGQRFHARTEIVEFGSAGGDPITTICMFSMRPEVRRLEGPVADDSPWPDRHSFVQTLNELTSAGLAWWDGAYDQNAAHIIERATGVPLSREAFDAIVTETFGGLDDALNAACGLPEIRHTPLLLVAPSRDERDPQVFRGMRWVLPEVSQTRSLDRLFIKELAIARTLTADMRVPFRLANLWGGQPETYDYMMNLRPLPVPVNAD